MKISVKITAVILSLTLAVLSFSACSFNSKKIDNTTTSAQTTENLTEDTDETTVEDKTTATETTSETLTSKIEKISADTVLSLIKAFPIGTAGSTAKSVDIALHMLNFSQQCDDTDDLKADCKRFYGELSAREKMIFEENLAEIDAVARGLIDGKESLEKYTEDSNEKYDKGNYNLEKYEAVYNIISNV